MTSLIDALDLHSDALKRAMKHHELVCHLRKMRSLARDINKALTHPPNEGETLLCGYCLTAFPIDRPIDLLNHYDTVHGDVALRMNVALLVDLD